MYLLQKIKGFTLIEAVMATGIFAIFVVGIFASLQFTLSLVHQSKVRIIANGILSEQMELIKNVSYENVGIINGIPNGVFERTTTIDRDGLLFEITRTIRYVDDPYDGLATDENNYDTYPGDYKFVQIEVICISCGQSKPILITAHIGPDIIETNPENGAAAIRVVDSTGNPISNAFVHILREGFDLVGEISLQDILSNLATRMVVVGNYAYLLDQDVLTIFDMGNMENIIVAGSLTHERLTSSRQIKVVGNYAYIATYYRLEIVDISNPLAPTLLGEGFEGTSSALFFSNFDVVGDFAYLTSSFYNSLNVVDVSNPAQPQLTQSFQDNDRFVGISAVRVVNDRAFVVTQETRSGNPARFEVLDISNPWWVEFVGDGVYPILSHSSANNHRMEIFEDRAYVISYGTHSLQIFNISDPTNIVVEGHVQDADMLAGPVDLSVVGQEVYVASYLGNSIVKVNIANPLNPAAVGEMKDNELLYGIRSLHVLGKYAYVLINPTGSDDRALRVFDISSIDIIDTTDNTGYLYVYNMPASVFSLKVWKDGHTEAFTIEPSESNLNPINPPLVVSPQTLTTYTLTIDPGATIVVNTVNVACELVGSVTFPFRGTRLIGQDPDVYMVDTTHTTDASGNKNILNEYWDMYWSEPRVMFLSNHTYAGMIPPPPISISSGETRRVTMVAEPNSQHSLWVLIERDAIYGNTIPIIPQGGVTTTLTGPNEYVESRKTGQGWWFVHFDGSMPNFLANMAFMSENVMMFGGSVSLWSSETIMSGYGESAMYTFPDEVRYHALSFGRTTSPSSTVRMQIATSNNPSESVWEFVGPDGTDRTYYMGNLTDMYVGHLGQKYFKFRVYFDRIDGADVPSISIIDMLYTEVCNPPGQAYFGNLSSGTYTVTVEKYNDFVEYEETFNISEKNYIRHTLTYE